MYTYDVELYLIRLTDIILFLAYKLQSYRQAIQT